MDYIVHGVAKNRTQLSNLHFHGPNIPNSFAILFFIASDFTFITRHICDWTSFLFWPRLFNLSAATSLLFPSSMLETFWPEGLNFHCHIFLHKKCSSHFWDKNTRVVFHSFLKWTTFCQNSPLWSILLGWSCTAWLIVSFSYASLFSRTRLLSIKGFSILLSFYFNK